MSTGKLLIVDDDRNFLELLKTPLEMAGHEVTAAYNEEEALGKVHGEVFDLSIVDLRLVRQDGITHEDDFRRRNHNPDRSRVGSRMLLKDNIRRSPMQD